MEAQARMDAWIASLGTAQAERDAPALQPGHAPLDDRGPVQLLQAAQALAGLLRFYGSSDTAPSGSWQPYLPAGDTAALQALVDHADGRLEPHHALLLAFLKIAQPSQDLLNGFTALHLQHQMRSVLGFRNQPPRADHAHLVLGLKKGAPPFELNASHAFSAGKDALKVDQRFVPVRPVVLGQAQVHGLCVVARDGPALHFAPKADSADGLGAPLPAPGTGGAQGWAPFSAAQRPRAPVGFALASPVLRLAEGMRSIAIHLHFAAGVQPQHDALAASLQAYASGPKGWLGPFNLQGGFDGDRCTLRLEVPPGEDALVDHDPAVHQHAFPAGLPVLQLLLKPGAALDYAALMPLRLHAVQLSVQVAGLRRLALENDDGALDAKKAFLPFGSQPARGSRLFVGCEEALSKRVTQLTLHLRWQGAPTSLRSWYAGYTRVNDVADGIRATVAWAGAGGTGMTSAPLTVLPSNGSAVSLNPAAPAGSGAAVSAFSKQHGLMQLIGAGNGLTLQIAQGLLLAQPFLLGGSAGGPREPRSGFITVTLQESLLHGDYTRDAVAGALRTPNPIALNPPYTPKAEQLTLDYSADSDLSLLDSATDQAFQQTEVQLHHVDAFGTRREHAWLHSLRPWAGEADAALLPQHAAAGELLIGLAPAQAGDSFSLLLQVADGSADPTATPQALQWSVLANDAWHPLGAAEGLLDTTDHLRRSGLLAGVLPPATSTQHSLMPAGRVWLRASMAQQPLAACRVLGVHANAAEVVFVDQGNDPARLAAPLPAGSIAKAATPLASLKTVAQPYASFGGALAETDAALARRAAERLRHRNRAVTPWDYEHLVLQAFPSIYRAKCVPHADGSHWQAAGHSLVVVVPRQQGLNAVDPLAPRADLGTLEAIRQHLQARCAPQAVVHVANPRYQPLQLQFKVRMRPGFGFAFYRNVLNQALLQRLSPWAFDDAQADGAEPGFNGRIVRSALLDFVEAQPCVDFVTDFALFRQGQPQDLAEVAPDAPDAILVSAAQHLITELPA